MEKEITLEEFDQLDRYCEDLTGIKQYEIFISRIFVKFRKETIIFPFLSAKLCLQR